MSFPADAHICFICPYIGPYLDPGSSKHVGGAERQQHLLATEFRDTGRRVSFITFEGDGPEYERIDGFDCWKSLPPTNDIRRAPAVALKLLRRIRSVDADIYYVRGNPPLCILASYCCSLLDKRLVYVVANDSNVELSRLSRHHGVFEYTLPKLGYLAAIRRADHVVAQTDHQQAILRDVFGIDSTVIANGYTVPPAGEVNPARERSHVLWVGSLDTDQKRPGRMLDLADRLPAVSFCMIGWTEDDAYRNTFIDRVADRPNLTFEGFVPPDEIDQYYNDAIALVNTSEYEGFPNTFLEAWRFGVPVVSLNEVLDSVLETEGIGIHAGSMDALERAVETLWNDPDRAAEIGTAGRRYLEENYALDVVAAKYEAVFADVLASPDVRRDAETPLQ